jgi:glycogen(starch) synthase
MPWARVIVTPDRRQVESMPLIGLRTVIEIPLAANLRPGDVDPAARARPAADANALAHSGDELIVGTWGLLRHDKGIDLLIDAFEAVAARRPARLVIAGDPGKDEAYVEQVERRIAASPVAALIARTGRLPEDELVAALRSFDACVLPYRAGLEGNRGTYATAIACGVHVITTSPTERGFDPATNTTFVAPGDVPALVEAIWAAREHPCRPVVDPAAEWASIAARHVQVYRGGRR